MALPAWLLPLLFIAVAAIAVGYSWLLTCWQFWLACLLACCRRRPCCMWSSGARHGCFHSVVKESKDYGNRHEHDTNTRSVVHACVAASCSMNAAATRATLRDPRMNLLSHARRPLAPYPPNLSHPLPPKPMCS